MITSDTIKDFFDHSKENENNQIFISENDIVLHFALFMHKKFPSAKIKFEFPFKITYSYKFNNIPENRVTQTGYLDLYVNLNNIVYGFEFKYKTSKLTVKNDLMAFELKNQGAQDILRFEFRRDIHRLEYLKNKSILGNIKINYGFAILLTNDRLLLEHGNTETADRELRFSDIIPIRGGSFIWHEKNTEAKWLKEYKFTMDLHLEKNQYETKWLDYLNYEGDENNKNTQFKYCIVEV
jgi:hypothetical protein